MSFLPNALRDLTHHALVGEKTMMIGTHEKPSHYTGELDKNGKACGHGSAKNPKHPNC